MLKEYVRGPPRTGARRGPGTPDRTFRDAPSKEPHPKVLVPPAAHFLLTSGHPFSCALPATSLRGHPPPPAGPRVVPPGRPAPPPPAAGRPPPPSPAAPSGAPPSRPLPPVPPPFPPAAPGPR